MADGNSTTSGFLFDDGDQRKCSICKTIKHISEFHSHRSQGFWRQRQCKDCQIRKWAQYRERPGVRQRMRENNAKYRVKPDNKIKSFAARLLRVFGITIDYYNTLMAAQKMLCAICGKRIGNGKDGSRMAHLDHCHKSGKVREILCGHCNQAQGLLGDDPLVMRLAVSYQFKHHPEKFNYAEIIKTPAGYAAIDTVFQPDGTSSIYDERLSV